MVAEKLIAQLGKEPLPAVPVEKRKRGRPPKKSVRQDTQQVTVCETKSPPVQELEVERERELPSVPEPEPASIQIQEESQQTEESLLDEDMLQSMENFMNLMG